jgi:gliding motility-associated-like protein
MRKYISLLVIVAAALQLKAQCVTNVDFNTWSQAGWTANGNWTPQGGGSTVFQSVNGNPTFFVSPFDLMNVRITGSFRTTSTDDDMMGFVFCFRSPFGQSDSFDTWLFDWKQGQQTSGGYIAYPGKSLCKIKGNVPPSAYAQTFWGHQNTPAFTVAQNDFPGAGWVLNYDHTFELVLSFTRALIYVDGQLVFDHSDCFVPGRFGFYNYSQQNCYYSNFQYTLDVDFTMPDTAVCQNSAAQFMFYTPCSGSNFIFSQYQAIVWDYGDGTADTIIAPLMSDMNATHVYAQPGVYNATLSVIDGFGCTASATRTITVLDRVEADFNAPPVCNGNPSSFTDVSTAVPNSWAWSFDDGNTSTTPSPTHTYSTHGSYNVTLIANNANNCGDTVTKAVTVYEAVTAGFTTGDECYGDSVSFNNTSTGPIVADSWSFGNGVTSVQQSPVYFYPASGVYNAQLIVSSADGCADTAVQTVTVFPKPDALFAVSNVCATAPSVFTNNSQVTSGAITNYAWSFGDGNTDNQPSPQHTYGNAGTYQVVLVVSTDNNCLDTATATTVVNPNPSASFTTGAVCLNNATVFNNTSAISSGSIAQHVWDFGDGQQGSQQSPVYTYNAQGTYTVSLLEISDSSCVDSFSLSVTVYDKPVAAYTVTEVCFGAPTVFTDQSTINAGSITQWAYTLGDGNTSAQQNPLPVYAVYGTYQTQLIVTSDNGCADTATQVVTVNPLPVVNFTAPDVCLLYTTNFTNTSNIPLGNISAWNWSFGDGNTSALQQPGNTYAQAGSYTVKLVATSGEGCEDSSTINITVFELPTVTTASTPACYMDDNGTVEAFAASGTSPYDFVWSCPAVTPQVQDLPAGTYTVTVTDANTCTVTATETVAQPAGPLVATATPQPAEIEIGEMLNMSLLNSYNDAQAVYTISPAYGLSCYTCEQFEAFPYRTTHYTIEVTDALGCPGSGEFTVVVDEALPVFIPNVFTPNGDGQNDTWGIFSRGVKYVSLQLFNRWGEKVFETDNLNSQWDGTYLGKPAEPGVYVYEGRMVFLSDENRPVKGTVTLLR